MGNANGQVAMGIVKLNGLDGSVDHPAAWTWFQKAANQGSSWGLRMQGLCHKDGLGVEKDLVKAVSCFKSSAEGGDVLGQLYYGTHLLVTEGTTPDEKRVGLTWVRKAAETGNGRAMLMYGACLIDGLGTSIDIDEGRRWLTLAEKNGIKEATELLAKIEADALSWDEDPG